MTVYAITDTKKGRTGIAPTYLHTTRNIQWHEHRATSLRQLSLLNTLYRIVSYQAQPVALRRIFATSSSLRAVRRPVLRVAVSTTTRPTESVNYLASLTPAPLGAIADPTVSRAVTPACPFIRGEQGLPARFACPGSSYSGDWRGARLNSSPFTRPTTLFTITWWQRKFKKHK